MASRVFALVLNPAVSTYAAQGVTGKCDSSVSTYNNFAYDGVFNLTSVDSTIPSTSFGGTDSFTYDSKDRLTAQSSTRNYRYSESFAYDGAGNPTTFSGSARTYNSDNQRTGSGTFAYDANGNPTTYTGGIFGTATCAYDRENRLTAIGSSWTAGYRADGLRAWKQVGSTKVYYLYDNGNPVMELDSSGNVIAVNGYGADGLYARWWAWNNSATTYYMFDQQGNVAERYDGNGNLISSNMNDAYGNEAYSTYGNDPFGYNAKWGYTYDRETGMFLCQHRYYDPANGRWLTRDPIGYAGGVNVYGYCGSAPIGKTDRAGLQYETGIPFLLGSAYQQAAAAGREAEFVDGMNCGCHGFLSGASFGIYDGGKYKNYEGFGVAAFAGNISSCLLGGELLGGAGRALGLGAKAEAAAEPMVSVGRWMSPEEYAAMEQTGLVQPSFSAAPKEMSFGICPPEASAFRAARPNNGFVTFDVPASSLSPGGGPGWVNINGGNSLFGGLHGLPSGMPPFRNLGPFVGP